MNELNHKSCLIIGIGNACREDDGLGWRFVDQLLKQGFDEKNVEYKYQLMVEDAALLAEYDCVVFVDASKNQLSGGVDFARCIPAPAAAFSTHYMPPEQVLHLCSTLFQAKPNAFLLEIQGEQWGIGTGISQRAAGNLEKAVKIFTHWYDKSIKKTKNKVIKKETV